MIKMSSPMGMAVRKIPEGLLKLSNTVGEIKVQLNALPKKNGEWKLERGAILIGEDVERFTTDYNEYADKHLDETLIK